MPKMRTRAEHTLFTPIMDAERQERSINFQFIGAVIVSLAFAGLFWWGVGQLVVWGWHWMKH